MVFLSPSNQSANIWAIGETNEKEQAEAFADKLQVLLEKQGVAVVRADNVTPSSRISYAKGCMLYVPLHTNAYNKKVRGNRLFAYKTKKNTKPDLADKNAAAMEAIRAEVDRLGMSRNVLVYYDYANWAELSNAANAGIPAVYSEAIFHDNVEDCEWYFANVDRLARAYARGICTYLGVAYNEVGTAPNIPEKVEDKPAMQDKPVESENFYRIRLSWDNAKSQIGAYGSLDNAKSACLDGYTVYDKDGKAVHKNGDVEKSNVEIKLNVLKRGAEGNEVRALQMLLVGNGYPIVVDGSFGAKTEDALEFYQEDNDLVSDGSCGPKTWAKLLGVK